MKVQEIKNGPESYFQLTDDQGEITNVNVHIYQISKNQFQYLLPYTESMDLLLGAYDYLNNFCGDQSLNTRLQKAQTLKYLFCFQRLFGIDLANMKREQINLFKQFLKGYSFLNSTIEIKLMTVRSNKTINLMLSNVRNFMNAMGYNCSAINEKMPRYSTTYQQITDQFVTSVKDGSPVEVPRYISVEQYKAIISVIQKNGSLRDEILVRLGFEYGMRLGECLGLTLEDLWMHTDPFTGRVYYDLEIRNRVSDSKQQCAKGCMKLESVQAYKNKSYQSLDYGYQVIQLDKSTYNLIAKYITEIHEPLLMDENVRKYDKSIADHSSHHQELDFENHYLFLNRDQAPLSQTAFNYHLRQIYQAAGIPIDTSEKKHNLFHRLRHGFAMFNIQYLHTDKITLMKRLRHHSIASVERYYRPTRDDQQKIQQEYLEELYTLVPGLRPKEEPDE